MSVSDKILAALRKAIASGTTVYSISKATGVAQGIIARFVSGERKQIRSETIDRLCGYLGLDLGPIDGDREPAADAGKHDRAASGPATGKAAANRRGEKKAGRNAAGKPKSAASAAPSPPKIADAGEVPKPAKRKAAKRKPGGRQR